MPAPDLEPQVPGEQPTQAKEPTGNPLADLPELASLNVADVTGTLTDLTPEELEALQELETEGKNRVTLLDAIKAEIAARKPSEVTSVAKPVATSKVPAKFDVPVMTKAGWVVPEPHQKSTPTPKA